MQFTFIGTGIVLCMAVLIVAGCLGSGSPDTQTPSPGLTGTPVKEGHVVANETQSGATVYVNKSSDITVKLNENPTTGYQWNMTLSPGLSLINDTYVSSDTSGKLAGAGGDPFMGHSCIGDRYADNPCSLRTLLGTHHRERDRI